MVFFDCRMPVKIYHDTDADVSIVQNKTVSFIGYGNQGRAQALNLRDSGVKNIVSEISMMIMRNKLVKMDLIQLVSKKLSNKVIFSCY